MAPKWKAHIDSCLLKWIRLQNFLQDYKGQGTPGKINGLKRGLQRAKAADHQKIKWLERIPVKESGKEDARTKR